MNQQQRNICILDYGSGNTRSVYNMLQILECNITVSNRSEDIAAATHLILPGVGAFASAMVRIRERLPMQLIEQIVFEQKRPFLGICVGMQILADTGNEFEQAPGLGWIPGEVRKLNTGGLPLPHVGWNNVHELNEASLIRDIKADIDFYFVHSYAFYPSDEKHVLAKTQYGESFPTIVARDNIYGVQFHPEKSQRAGVHLMENFLKLS